LPPVWAVSEVQAKIIALAELNRWQPGRMEMIKWRNPAFCSEYAPSATATGAGKDTVWSVSMVLGADKFSATVGNTGKVIEIMDGGGTSLGMVTQGIDHARDAPFTYQWIGAQ
jgi:hypothetical protein